MKKYILIIACMLILVGCGKKEINLSYIDTNCCIDNGGVNKDGTCSALDYYNKNDYEKCISYSYDNAKQCCSDFEGHWNNYTKTCKLNSSDSDLFMDCINGYDWFDEYLDDKYGK